MDDQFKHENCYNGNQNLKRTGVKMRLSIFEMEEMVKCAESVEYFLATYGRIISLDDGVVPFKLYEFQRKMLQTVQDNRFSILMLPRQYGKCSSLNTVVTVKNKKTGETEEITVGELHERSKTSSTKNTSKEVGGV